MRDKRYLQHCKEHKIDPATGRKLKPKFNKQVKQELFKGINQKYFFEIKELNLDISKIIEDIYSGFSNTEIYWQKNYPTTVYEKFKRVFITIKQRIGEYK